MKSYVVTYISAYGFHERFRCTAKNKREARKECKECLNSFCEKITEVEEDF